MNRPFFLPTGIQNVLKEIREENYKEFSCQILLRNYMLCFSRNSSTDVSKELGCESWANITRTKMPLLLTYHPIYAYVPLNTSRFYNRKRGNFCLARCGSWPRYSSPLRGACTTLVIIIWSYMHNYLILYVFV